MDGSGLLGILGVLVLVVFGSQYILAEAVAGEFFFSSGILNLALVGIAVIVIAVGIYSQFKDF